MPDKITVADVRLPIEDIAQNAGFAVNYLDKGEILGALYSIRTAIGRAHEAEDQLFALYRQRSFGKS